MFCQNCGKEISEDTKFCPACGTAVNQVSAPVEIKEQKEVAEYSPESLHKCYDFFSQIANVYDLWSIGNNLINNVTWCKKVKKEYTSAIVCLCFGIIDGLFSWIWLSSDFKSLGLFTWSLLSIPLDAFAIIGGLIFTIIYGNHKSTIEFYQSKLPEYHETIAAHYKQYENCPLPIEYSDPVAISSIISYLKSKRADNLKEAFNLYEEECHRNQVLTELKEMKAAAKKAATAATIAAINTSIQ